MVSGWPLRSVPLLVFSLVLLAVLLPVPLAAKSCTKHANVSGEYTSWWANSPHVTTLRHGVAFAVWTEWDGGYYSLYANRYTVADGWGEVESVETIDRNFQDPIVAVDASGNAMVVFEDSDRSDIFAARRPAGGVWEEPVRLDTLGGSAGAEKPYIAMNAAGSAVAVFKKAISGRFQVGSNSYVPGTGWRGFERVDDDEFASDRDPLVAIDDQAHALAVWPQADGTEIAASVFSYDPMGDSWSEPTVLGPGASGVGLPSVAMNPNGRAMIVWASSPDLLAASYYAGSFGSTLPVEGQILGPASKPSADIDDAGNAVVIWTQSNGETVDVWANDFDALTGSWGEEQQLEDNGWWDTEPHVAVDKDGRAMAGWTDNGETSEGALARCVHAAEYVNGGWGSLFIPQLCTNAERNPQPMIFDNGEHQVLLYRQVDVYTNGAVDMEIGSTECGPWIFRDDFESSLLWQWSDVH